MPKNWKIPLDEIYSEIIIWQAEEDSLTGKMAEHLAKQLPNSKLIEISNAGHLWIMETMKKKYILLAGATGYLGRFIASELHEQDYSATIYKAMSDRNPKYKYLIDPGAKKMNALRKFPAKTRDKMLAKAIYK